MIFLISLCISLLLVFTCAKSLRSRPLPFYLGAAFLACFSVVSTWFNIPYPQMFTTWVLPIFARGALAGALFVLVMYAGAFPPGSYGAKTFMPIRAQLSIIACILTIGHNVAYGRTYFTMLFSNAGDMQLGVLIASILSLVMIIIMLPLFITSFTFVRKKMDGRKWKKLQRLAYVFYVCLFLHVMLLTVPRAITGTPGYDITVFVYSFVFISYFICRIYRALYQKDKDKMVRRQFRGVSISLLLATILVARVTALAKEGSSANSSNQNKPAVAGVSRSVSDEEADDENEAVNEDADSANEDILADGTYYGEGMGNNGKIGVNVTVKDGAIAGIEIVKFPDDSEYFDPDKDGALMIQNMIDTQSTGVDTVSGATYSSEGLIDAVENALYGNK